MKPTWLVTNRWLHWDKFEWQFDQIIGASHGQIERVTTDYAVTHLDNLPEVAFIMDKDVAAVAQLEAFGVRCVNSSQSIALCDNKAYTHAALTRAGIAHPKTITAPLVYRNLAAEEWASSEFLAAVEHSLGFPAVAKHAVGSWGSGVFLVENRDELIDVLREAYPAPVIVEEYVAGSHGRDARIYMVGDTPVAAMRRFGQGGDFRANITGGGRAQTWDPPAEYVDVARAAMAALGLDIGSVDFLDAQEPLVGEVNSNAQFASLTETTGIDVAAAVVEYLEQL
ncbi:ATP-grasp domain-containing protein [Corynebacterium coyleae]